MVEFFCVISMWRLGQRKNEYFVFRCHGVVCLYPFEYLFIVTLVCSILLERCLRISRFKENSF